MGRFFVFFFLFFDFHIFLELKHMQTPFLPGTNFGAEIDGQQ